MIRTTSLLLALFLVACGGGAARPDAGTGSSGTGSGTGTGGEAETETEGEGETAAEEEEFPLEDVGVVAGTGVSVRPPRGADPMPTGSGFMHTRRRIQILVAEAEGSDAVLDAFREQLTGEGTPEIDPEDIDVSGHTGTLGIDRVENGDVELERVWVMVREGDRAMAVIGAYLADRSERYRGLVRASVTSAEWDPSIPIDAEQAMGFAMDVEGLVLDRTATSPLTYAPSGAAVPPSPNDPRLFLLALPVNIPTADRDDVCEQLLLQAGPVDEDHVVSRGEIETDELGGCEVVGAITPPATDEDEDPDEVSAYAAIIFHDDGIFLAAGLGGSTDGAAWMERFAEAARSLHRVRE
jgi:hypothetical protein